MTGNDEDRIEPKLAEKNMIATSTIASRSIITRTENPNAVILRKETPQNKKGGDKNVH